MLTQISKKTHLVQTKTRPTSANTQSIAFSNNGKSVYVPLVPVNSKGKTVMNSASCGTRMFQNHKRQQVQTKTYAGQSLIFDYLPGTHQYPRIEIPNNEQHLQDISLQEEMDFPSRERCVLFSLKYFLHIVRVTTMTYNSTQKKFSFFRPNIAGTLEWNEIRKSKT